MSSKPDDADLLLSGGDDGTARLLHLKNKAVLITLAHSPADDAHGTVVHDDDDGGVGGALSVEGVGFCASAAHPWCATAGVDGALKVRAARARANARALLLEKPSGISSGRPLPPLRLPLSAPLGWERVGTLPPRVRA